MSNNLYMPLYIGDYLTDAAHLNVTEHGAYLLLIMNYWQRGEPLPADDLKLSRIAKMTREQWAECRDLILEFFEEQDGLLHHGRIDAELQRAKEKSAKARGSANARHANKEQASCERDANAQRPQGEGNANKDKDKDSKNSLSEPSSDGVLFSLVPSQDGDHAPDGKRKRRPYPADFEAFWSKYPVIGNSGKHEAAQVWAKMAPEDRSMAVAGLAGYGAFIRSKPDYTPLHVATYLSKRRYEIYQRDGKPAPAAGPEPLPDDAILKFLRNFARSDNWPGGLVYDRIGPPPGKPGCRIPPHLLAEYERMRAEENERLAG